MVENQATIMCVRESKHGRELHGAGTRSLNTP